MTRLTIRRHRSSAAWPIGQQQVIGRGRIGAAFPYLVADGTARLAYLRLFTPIAGRLYPR